VDEYSEPVGLDDSFHIDLIVVGCVAVSPTGNCMLCRQQHYVTSVGVCGWQKMNSVRFCKKTAVFSSFSFLHKKCFRL